MKLQDLENQISPKILYHYTCQSGLIGILMDQEIWATKIHYMNDSREFALALDLTRGELKDRIAKEDSGTERRRLEVLLDEVDRIAYVNVCVCSFSELGDSLNQWRGYTSGGAGFSIGFSTKELLKFAQENEFHLYPCVYDIEIQKSLVNEVIEDLLQTDFNTIPFRIPESQPRTVHVLRTGGNFGKRLTHIAPLIKHPSFSEEKEWRLVSQPINSNKLNHRHGESMIVPYYRLPIASDDEFRSVGEIIVGPTPHPKLSKDSVSSLLSAGLTKRPTVRATNVPYRHW